MPDGITVKVEGLAELERAMNRLDEKLAKKGAVEAVRAGNKLLKGAIVAAARAKFQRRTGKLLANIRTSLRIKGRGVKGATVKIFTFLKSDAFYGRFWELGFTHIGRGKGRRKQHRRGITITLKSGKEAPKLRREWMRPAMEEVAPRVIEAMTAKLRRFIKPGV